MAKPSKLDMEQDDLEKFGIRGISDKRITEKLRQLSENIVEEETELDEEWITSHDWVVVPTESDMSARDAEWLSGACSAFGYKTCFAFVTEKNAIDPGRYTYQYNSFVDRLQNIFKVNPPEYACYEFLTTKKGIENISREFANHHLLMPEDQGFAILRPYGLYSLIAGPKKFVEIAVGSTIETAREMFWEFASPDWPEADRAFLTQIARKYQSISAA